MLKTDVSGLHPVTFDGQAVSAAFDLIAALLRSSIRDTTHQLFAEPVESGTNRSWYGEGTGEPVAMVDLPAADRATAETFLRRALESLEPLLDDREMGPLLRRALIVPSLQSVVALDDGVVLTDWGFGPAGLGDDAAALARHLSSVFGPYNTRLASISADFFDKAPTGGTRRAVAAAAVVGLPVTAAAAAATSAPSGGASRMASAAAAIPVGGRSRNLWLIPMFAAVAGMFLILGFWLAWTHLVKDLAGRQFQTPLGDEKATRLAIQTQRDTNAALERELANARRALDSSNVCSPDFPTGSTPAPERQPIQPGTVPTPAPERRGEAPLPFNGSLASLLEHATAWIVVQTPNGIGSGTGFFVTTDTILTNAHVVQNAAEQRVYVTSKTMGKVYLGQVVALTKGPGGAEVGIGMADFALVRLPDVVPGAQPLAFSDKAEKLTDVVAAGYPAAIIKQEDAVQELRQGHLTGAPELVLTRGSISTMQHLPNGLTIMPHSADISAGNSGGPLVDWCGSVLGVNTFVTASERFVDRTKYALRSDAVLQWLAQQNVAIQRHDGECHPIQPTPTAPPMASAPSATPPGAPGSFAGPPTAASTPAGPPPATSAAPK
jgi:S1-C subfamily serine protease